MPSTTTEYLGFKYPALLFSSNFAEFLTSRASARDIDHLAVTLHFLIQLCQWGGGGTGEGRASCTKFSCLPYFCAPLPPDSHPSLCCVLRVAPVFRLIKRIRNPG